MLEAAGWALAHILQLTLPFLALTAPIGTLPFQDVDAVVGFANDPLDVLERRAFRRPLCWLGVDIRLKVPVARAFLFLRSVLNFRPVLKSGPVSVISTCFDF